MNIEWKRRLIILGITVGTIAGYRYLVPVLLPFVAAWLLAGWLYPWAAKIEKKTKIKKSLAGSIFLALIFAVIGFVLYIIVREILAQVKTAVSNFPVVLHWCGVFLDKCCVLIEDVTGIARDTSRTYILNQTSGLQKQFLAEMSPQTVRGIFSGVKGVLVIFSGLVVTFISCVLLISDMENMRKKIWDYTWLVGVRRVVKRLKRTTVTYLKAQLLLIVLVAVVCAAGFWLMGSPYFLILGIALGVLDALPILGTGSFLYPAALFFLIKGNTGVAAGCVILDIVTSVLREYLEPRLVGDKLGVPPIAVLASVYVGIFLYGAWGFFLGPLSFSTIYEVGRQWDVWD